MPGLPKHLRTAGFAVLILLLAAFALSAQAGGLLSQTGPYEHLLDDMDPDYRIVNGRKGVSYDYESNTTVFTDDQLAKYQLHFEDGQVKILSDVMPVEPGKVPPPKGTLIPFDTEKLKGRFEVDNGKAMYVMDAEGKIFVLADNMQGTSGQLHHSTIGQQKPVVGAGMMRVENGKIVNVSNSSGHYRPEADRLAAVDDVLKNRYGMGGYTLSQVNETTPRRPRYPRPGGRTPPMDEPEPRVNRKAQPAGAPDPDSPPARSGNRKGLPDLADGDPGNRSLRQSASKAAQEIFDERQPSLSGVENRSSVVDADDVVSRATQQAERAMVQQTKKLFKAPAARDLQLQLHLAKKAAQRKGAAMKKALAEWAEAQGPKIRRDLARIRDLAMGRGNIKELIGFMNALDTAQNIVAWSRAYYDGGWPAVKEAVKDQFFIQAIMTGSVMAIYHVNQTGQAMVTYVLPKLTPALVSVSLFMMAKDISYMTLDYFMLEPNRRRLIQRFFPLSANHGRPATFWEFYAEAYGPSLTPKTLYQIFDRWQNTRRLDVNLDEDLATMTEILVSRYRTWLREKRAGEIYGLRAFQDDPSLWHSLATVVFQAMKASVLRRNMEEIRKIEVRRMLAVEQAAEAKHRAALQDSQKPLPPPVLGFIKEPSIPTQIKKGDPLEFEAQYLVYGLPDENY
jgi:hypothetical protein